MLDWGELSALDEESARRYVAMTCQTDDPEAERAYLHFVEQIEPQTKPRQFALERSYLAHPVHPQLEPARYAIFNRHTTTRVELYRDNNVPLETEETCLGQQYQKRSGSLTVSFRGEELTLVRMSPSVEEPDRPVRQDAWERVAARAYRKDRVRCTVECPLHGAEFDLASGAVLTPPAPEPVTVYPVRVNGDVIEIGLPSEGP